MIIDLLDRFSVGLAIGWTFLKKEDVEDDEDYDMLAIHLLIFDIVIMY